MAWVRWSRVALLVYSEYVSGERMIPLYEFHSLEEVYISQHSNPKIDF